MNFFYGYTRDLRNAWFCVSFCRISQCFQAVNQSGGWSWEEYDVYILEGLECWKSYTWLPLTVNVLNFHWELQPKLFVIICSNHITSKVLYFFWHTCSIAIIKVRAMHCTVMGENVPWELVNKSNFDTKWPKYHALTKTDRYPKNIYK